MLTDVRRWDDWALKEVSPALERIASLLRPEELNLRQEYAEERRF